MHVTSTPKKHPAPFVLNVKKIWASHLRPRAFIPTETMEAARELSEIERHAKEVLAGTGGSEK